MITVDRDLLEQVLTILHDDYDEAVDLDAHHTRYGHADCIAFTCQDVGDLRLALRDIVEGHPDEDVAAAAYTLLQHGCAVDHVGYNQYVAIWLDIAAA